MPHKRSGVLCRFFSVPTFSDESQANSAHCIFTHLISFIFVYTGMTTLVMFILPVPKYFWLGLIVAPLTVNLFLLTVARHGHLRLVSLFFVVELWLLITIHAFMQVGLGARAAWGFFIVVFCAGMLLGRWAGIVAAGVCSLTTMAIAFFPRVISPHPWLFWLINTLYLVVMIFLQSMANRSIHELLTKTGSESRERLLAKAALFKSEKKHREMVNSLPICIFEEDLKGNITYANRTALDWFGYSETEVKNGLNILDVTFDSDKQRIMENTRRIIAGEEFPFHEYLLKRKDGSCFTALIRARRIFEDGTLVGLQGSVIDISIRKQAEKEKEQIISLLKATLESTADGILVVDLSGRVSHFNQRFAQMWQIPDEILASGEDAQALAFVCDQLLDPQAFVLNVQKLYTDSLAESFDLLEFKDGRYFERYSRPQLLGGRPVGRVWSFRDITERKRAEKEISAWKQRFESAVIASNQIFYDLEFATDNIQCSGSIENVLGYQISETNYSNWEELIAPGDREETIRLIKDSMKNGTPFCHEYDFKHQDGHYMRIFDRGLVMHDDAGKPERMIGMLQDITERKRAEEALLESERRYRAVFEAAGDAIFLMRGGRFVDCNVKTLELFGCSREYFINSSVEQLSPERQPDGRNSREKAEEKLHAALAGQPQRFDWVHLRSDGTSFPADVSMNRVELSSGSYLLVVIRDISDHRLLEKQLLQAQKMEAIGILAGGVAHDFNNILSTIVGYATLIQMKIKDDCQLKEYAERILVSTERAVSLTHSLLAFSRKQEIELQSVEINSAIYGFHKMLTRLIGEDIDFDLDLPDPSLVVEVDVRQFEQVLMNLVTNSRDAMPNGGKLTISTKNLQLDEASGEIPPGSYALISVADTGCGMDEKTIAHIFEPFFTTKEVGKGTGLGMAIVYGIIKKHDGFITVNSVVDRGTTFHIYLPLKPIQSKKRIQEESVKPLSGSETILLIEDDGTVRHAIRSILEEFGYRVIEAADGAEGVDLFSRENGKVQAVLCDLVMPKKNGRETVAEIRRIRPGTKVMFMSGYEADVLERKGSVAPDIPLLLKPVRPAELLSKLRQVIDS